MKFKTIIITAAAATALILLPSTAALCSGVSGCVYYSAIDTYINNYPINAYSADGRQLIFAEDLRSYGFDVIWDNDSRSLSIYPDTSAAVTPQPVVKQFYMQNKRFKNILESDIRVFLNGTEIPGYSVDGLTMIRLRELEAVGTVGYSPEENSSKAFIDGLPQTEYSPIPVSYDQKPVIVLDPGHGKDSSSMSWDEKESEGYSYVDGSWGEWRHWKNGTFGIDCEGYGCNGDHSCFYGMGNGDRDTEPGINLSNALYAKYYLENELGYTVRMTRESNDENPSFSKRVSYCFPDNDTSLAPDASCYVCVHSNAGGGRGTAYIEAEGGYTQNRIDDGYADDSNHLGMLINERITAETSLSRHSDGYISGEGYLILFNKSPVPAGYMEIGFFDSSDLSILNSEYDAIGKAIAYGIDDYMNGK